MKYNKEIYADNINTKYMNKFKILVCVILTWSFSGCRNSNSNIENTSASVRIQEENTPTRNNESVEKTCQFIFNCLKNNSVGEFESILPNLADLHETINRELEKGTDEYYIAMDKAENKVQNIKSDILKSFIYYSSSTSGIIWKDAVMKGVTKSLKDDNYIIKFNSYQDLNVEVELIRLSRGYILVNDFEIIEQSDFEKPAIEVTPAHDDNMN
jgi:hypothetical protein